MNLEKQKVIHKLLEQKYKSSRKFKKRNDELFVCEDGVICCGITIKTFEGGKDRDISKTALIKYNEARKKEHGIEMEPADDRPFEIYNEEIVRLTKEKYFNEFGKTKNNS